MKVERIDNIIRVRFDRECRLITPEIFQYDKGQKIEFSDVPDGIEVQFSSGDSGETSNKIITGSQVEIPDFLIAMNETITAYLQYIDENSQTTKKFLIIPVRERPKPEEYISEDDEPTFRAEIQNIMNETKTIAESVRADADSGAFNGINGKDGEPGKDGAVGPQGPKGDKGDTGEQGVQGIQGLQGEKGDKGDTGADGTVPLYNSETGYVEFVSENDYEKITNEKIEELMGGAY